MKKVKTNALRILDQKKINYEVNEYEVDLDKPMEGHRGLQKETEENKRTFKTLVLKGVKEYLVCCLPITKEIDLKKLAKASNNKSVEMIPQKELLPLTGYERGGCSPIGMKKKFKTYFQKEILDYNTIYVSAGRRGLQAIIAPQDLIQICDGVVVDIVKDIEKEDENQV